MCPANNESAGKHRSGKHRKGNHWLGATLNQCAWAASVKKGCYLGDRYRRIAARRGKKRAIVATAHAQLVIIYHLLSGGQPYREPSSSFSRLRSATAESDITCGGSRHLASRAPEVLHLRLELSEQAFDVTVLRRPAWLNELQSDAILLGPLIRRPPGELGSVVGAHENWLAPLPDQPV